MNSHRLINGLFSKGVNVVQVTPKTRYFSSEILPIPANIDVTESTRFSPQRSRDISAVVITSYRSAQEPSTIDVTLDNSTSTLDPHVKCYDCFGAISLHSVMQSNVPNPFGGMHKFTHLNMPGGQWSQEMKFTSHDLQNSHYMNLRHEWRSGWYNNRRSTMDVKESTPQIRM